jgi:hypothetical protein
MKGTQWIKVVVTVWLLQAMLVGQDKPVIVVHAFTAAADVPWPYDMKPMQTQTIAEIKAKIGKQYAVAAEAPPSVPAHVYTLDGEVLAWHPGNRAERMLVGGGTGRETADIHFWLTDETGKKVLEQKDTIKAEFWGNAYAGSVGQLSHPLASKVTQRLSKAKLN